MSTKRFPWAAIAVVFLVEFVGIAIVSGFGVRISGPSIALLTLPLVLLAGLGRRRCVEKSASEPEPELTTQAREIAGHLGVGSVTVALEHSLDSKKGVDYAWLEDRLYISPNLRKTMSESEQRYLLTRAILERQAGEREERLLQRTIAAFAFFGTVALLLVQVRSPWLVLVACLFAMIPLSLLIVRPLAKFRAARRAQILELTNDPTAAQSARPKIVRYLLEA